MLPTVKRWKPCHNKAGVKEHGGSKAWASTQCPIMNAWWVCHLSDVKNMVTCTMEQDNFHARIVFILRHIKVLLGDSEFKLLPGQFSQIIFEDIREVCAMDWFWLFTVCKEIQALGFMSSCTAYQCVSNRCSSTHECVHFAIAKNDWVKFIVWNNFFLMWNMI